MIAETIQNLHSTFFVLNTESQHNFGGAGQVQEYMFSLLVDACQSSESAVFCDMRHCWFYCCQDKFCDSNRLRTVLTGPLGKTHVRCIKVEGFHINFRAQESVSSDMQLLPSERFPMGAQLAACSSSTMCQGKAANT